jgi:hypothetical protein
MTSLRKLILLVTAVAAGACTSGTLTRPSPGSVATLQPRVAGCGSATPAGTEGPFYKAGPPEKTSLLEPGIPGTKLSLTALPCS